MKRMVRAVMRAAGYEIRSLSGPHRVSSAQTALSWLADARVDVGTILDVGASDGRWTEQALRSFPGVSCVLYEPNPVHLPGIRRFTSRHPGKVIHQETAVGRDTGTVRFDVSSAFGGALEDSASPSTANDPRFIQVPVVRLDDSVRDLELGPPFLLKLDTHGFEAGILEGAEATLQQSTVLFIEAYNHRLTSEGLYFWELCELLHERGFRPVDLVDIMHRERDGSLWQMDLVFLRDDWSGFRSHSYR